MRDIRLFEMLFHAQSRMRWLATYRLSLCDRRKQRQSEQCKQHTHGGTFQEW
jgi:hypothetical protein